ncbi:hypothetical protein HMP09_2772 [Sphingomonas sp. HMP9]|nr:hypothetical protein HMP09_2772 [Sphingomonas sp. HMP9]
MSSEWDVERDLLRLDGPVRRLGGIRCERQQALEEENTWPKRRRADTMLDNAALKDLL